MINIIKIKFKTINIILSCLIISSTLTIKPVIATPTSVDDAITKKEELLEEIQRTDTEIENMIQKVDEINKKIQDKSTEIDDCLLEIDRNSNKIIEKEKMLGERIRKSQGISVSQEINYLNLLLSADSFSDLVDKTTFLSKAIKYDRDLIQEINETKSNLEQNRKQIESNTKFLIDGKIYLEKENLELEEKKSEQKEQLSELNTYLLVNSNEMVRSLDLTFPGGEVEGNNVTELAATFLGVPYVWGGTTPSGFDCSGLVQYVYSKNGISVPRVSQDQQKIGETVSIEEAKPGDLVFFGYPAHHVGIYVGDGYMIHAPHTGDVVRYAKVNTNKVSNIKRVLK